MLIVLTALIDRKVQPETETIDRDPGIFALLATLARFVRRGIVALPASHQRANEAEVFSAANAWPYNHRSN